MGRPSPLQLQCCSPEAKETIKTPGQ